MIFDRITEIWLGNEETGYEKLDYSASNQRLLRIAADIYNSTFLKIIGDFTWNILKIVPKDRNGNPIEDLKTARVDSDQDQPGIQELKEWKAVINYIQNLPDTNGDGIANIPEKYRGKLGRNLREASWNPHKLLKRGTRVTWIAFGTLVFALFIVLMIGRFVVKRINNKHVS